MQKGPLTPGSETAAFMKDDIQIRKRYAKVIGMAGEMLYQSHFAL